MSMETKNIKIPPAWSRQKIQDKYKKMMHSVLVFEIHFQ